MGIFLSTGSPKGQGNVVVSGKGPVNGQSPDKGQDPVKGWTGQHEEHFRYRVSQTPGGGTTDKLFLINHNNKWKKIGNTVEVLRENNENNHQPRTR